MPDEITTNQLRDARIRREADDQNGLSSRGAGHRPPWRMGFYECGCMIAGGLREPACVERGLGHPYLLNANPKNIHEGTLNHLIMIQNKLAMAEPIEAAYLLCDLIDQVSNRALVITKRVEPLDHIAIQHDKDEAFARGRAEGIKVAQQSAENSVRKKVLDAIAKEIGL